MLVFSRLRVWAFVHHIMLYVQLQQLQISELTEQVYQNPIGENWRVPVKFFTFATMATYSIAILISLVMHCIIAHADPHVLQYTTVAMEPKDRAGILPDNYSALNPPTASGGPIQVEFSILIMNIRDIVEISQEITLEVNLHIFWVDNRLQNLTDGKEFVVLPPAALEGNIWTPDVFIDHTKAINQPALLTKPASLRLYANGGLRHSQRVAATISCPMNFRYYPADTQKCTFDLKSYAYPNNIVSFAWRKGADVKLVGNLELANFYLKLEEPEDYVNPTSSGFYSGIRFRIQLARKISYHMLQTYLPSTMFIVVSWLTFVMPQDSGATMICMTTLLTVTAMFASVRQSTPVVSYTKAIDTWMAVCMTYIFISLFQHIVTMRLRHMKVFKRGEERQPHHPFLEPNTDPPVDSDPSVLSVSFKMNRDSLPMRNLHNPQPAESSPDQVARRYARNIPTSLPPSPEDQLDQEKMMEYKVLGNKIRRVFSMVVPASFLLFNIIYWAWLLNSAE